MDGDPLQACLPAELRGATITITRMAAGLSGAGVYRIEVATQVFVLKVSPDSEPLADWRRKLDILERAAAADLAARVVHTDEARRAVLSDFVPDRSFPAFYADPRTRDAAVALLGQTLRCVHELPPPDEPPRDVRAILAGLGASFATSPLPPFVGEAIQRQLAEEPPASDRAPGLSHNDVNPTNLAYDGERLLLLDWDTAGTNDPLHDLAAISVFLRMDDATCRALLAAHDGAPVAVLPPGFAYHRRLVAVLCGAFFLHLARQLGHTGASGHTLDSAPSLVDIYQQLRSGSLSLATGQARHLFGLALLKESFAL